MDSEKGCNNTGEKEKQKEIIQFNLGERMWDTLNTQNNSVVNIENSAVTILLEIDGRIHMVAMPKERFETVDILIKNSIEYVISTDITQQEMNKFLGADSLRK